MRARLFALAASARCCSLHASAFAMNDPRGICERYTDDTYAKMRDDSARTAAYASASERHSWYVYIFMNWLGKAFFAFAYWRDIE